MARRQARAAAMQMVYENMLGGDGGEDTLQGLIGFEADEEDRAYLDSVVNGVAVDRLARRWKRGVALRCSTR